MRESPSRLNITVAWKLAAAILLLAIFIVGSSLASQRSRAQTPSPSIYGPGNVHIALPQAASRQAQLAPFAGAAPASVTNMTYNGGRVQQTVAVYTIFWNPHGTISPGYESLINRYFQDIGSSSFYNVLSQYYQLPGPVYTQNVSSLGGTFADSTPYPGNRGSQAHPISDQDIENEVTRALSLNPTWPAPGIGSQYFVYTEPGIESCYDPSAPRRDLSCSPGISSPYTYCAYHSTFGADVFYANMPYDETWTTACRTFSQSPNGNLAADSEISTSSHEHFETANDPVFDGWYDPSGAEIGDKCAYWYGTTEADGRNLTLNGDPYIIQLEWSNADSDGVNSNSGCVKMLACYSLELSASPADGGNPTANPTNSAGCPASQYTKNIPVTISPGTSFGYTFIGWTGDPDCTDGSVTMTASVSCTADFAASTDLSVTGSAAPNPAQMLNPLTYTFVVNNSGLLGTTGVTLSDTLDGSVTFGSATPSQGSCSQVAGTVACALGSIASSGSATVSIIVTPTTGGELTNTADVSDNEPDPNSANNSTTITTPALWQCSRSDSTVVYRAWSSPTGDDDCDGLTTANENFSGTLPLVACAATPTPDDEPPPDAWPVDFNNDQAANLTDIFRIVAHLNTTDNDPDSSPRFDLSKDGFINLTDIFKVIPFLNKSCAP